VSNLSPLKNAAAKPMTAIAIPAIIVIAAIFPDLLVPPANAIILVPIATARIKNHNNITQNPLPAAAGLTHIHEMTIQAIITKMLIRETILYKPLLFSRPSGGTGFTNYLVHERSPRGERS
jgi:hypothetical protein